MKNCVAFDGLRILSTGFEGAEKNRVHQLVNAMSGELCIQPSMDVDFVIARDVLAPKYKWAAFTLRKPILSILWLESCLSEHRRVPHEAYRLPFFTGVKISTTGILIEQRNKIAQFVEENGGTLKADLTRECTHLIAKSHESEKFKMVHTHWRHIKCVNEDWFWNSISEKVCLEESSHAVRGGDPSVPIVYQTISGPAPSEDNFSGGTAPSATVSVPDIVCSIQESGVQSGQGVDVKDISERKDMYLSGCRFFLTGLSFAEMRRLMDIVLSGGGTRFVEFNDKVTHVVLGKPSESELKDVRQNAVWGAVDIVMPAWLEECGRQKREVAMTAQFTVPRALLSNDSHWKQGRNKAVTVEEKKPVAESVRGRLLQRKLWDASESQSDAAADLVVSQDRDSLQQPLKKLASQPDTSQDLRNSKPASSQIPPKQVPAFVDVVRGAPNLAEKPIMHTVLSTAGCEDTRCEPTATAGVSHPNVGSKDGVFKGHVFGFALSFDNFKRAEVVQWVLEGGGAMLGDGGSGEPLDAEFMIFPHGTRTDPCLKPAIKSVTTQWIKCCLDEGTLLDTNSHILFQPLRCEVPLPGFQTLRFAVTQYLEFERQLLYNLCHVLGARYQEKKMNRKATHLLCKVGDGEKYEAALQWGVEIVTAEWLYACVDQNMVVLPDPYRPKKLTAADKEAGLAIPTQNPVQLTHPDTRVPLTERCSVENSAKIPLPENGNEVGRLEVKGKITTAKKKTSLREKMQALKRNSTIKDCPLTSQNGGNLDPWDELRASWDKESSAKGPITRSKQKAGASPILLSTDERPSELPADLQQLDTGGSQGNENRSQVPSSAERSVDPKGLDHQEDDSGGDVAAAIEGLLAQTSKVQSEDDSRSPDGDRDLLSHEPLKLGRRNGQGMRERANFKRPKLVAESGWETPVLSASVAEDSSEKFDESQMDSQVVAYDEDHSEKQRIMERVRTRSMSAFSFGGSEGNAQKKNTSWKATEFKRLLKAADANK